MNIINALPAIKPTARRCGVGTWPQSKAKMRNGRTARWPLASKPSGSSIELVWQNISYSDAELICAIWDNNYGIYGTVILPPEVFCGIGSPLADFLALPIEGATWHFSAAPRVSSVETGLCSVTIPIRSRAFLVYPT